MTIRCLWSLSQYSQSHLHCLFGAVSCRRPNHLRPHRLGSFWKICNPQFSIIVTDCCLWSSSYVLIFVSLLLCYCYWRSFFFLGWILNLFRFYKERRKRCCKELLVMRIHGGGRVISGQSNPNGSNKTSTVHLHLVFASVFLIKACRLEFPI